MGCSKLADRARLPIWFLSTERKHACLYTIELASRTKLIYGYYYFRVWRLWKCMFVSKHWCVIRYTLSTPFPLRRHNESMTSNYHFKIIGPKKRKWKLSHRTDTLVKSKYLIISFFSWKEIVKLHETMWPIRDNNTSNGYLFEQESSGETLNTMFVDNRWLISLQYMDVSIPMTL